MRHHCSFRRIAEALVIAAATLVLTTTAQAQRSRPMGAGPVTEPVDCGTNPGLECVVDLTVAVDDDLDTCGVAVPKVPFVLPGQTVRWKIAPGATDVEFLKKRGIRIDGNVYQKAPKKTYFDCSINASNSREFTCKRNASTPQEKEGRVFSYTVFIRQGTGPDRQICFVDPLIVSRD